jgi:hypothetical protein
MTIAVVSSIALVIRPGFEKTRAAFDICFESDIRNTSDTSDTSESTAAVLTPSARIVIIVPLSYSALNVPAAVRIEQFSYLYNRIYFCCKYHKRSEHRQHA